MMIRVLIICVFLVNGVLAVENVFAQAPQFFSSVQDVPLMEGLVEIPESMFQFDKAEGRVTQVEALLDGVSSSDVEQYYQAVLPQFGWSRIGPLNYERGNERLVLQFENSEGHDFLKVMIIPR